MDNADQPEYVIRAIDFLIESGFNRYKDNLSPESICFSRRTSVEPKCFHNGEKMSHFVEITRFDRWYSYQIYICAQTDRGLWIRNSFYSCSVEDLPRDLEDQCQMLNLGWIGMHPRSKS